jgi:hypothetical protein
MYDVISKNILKLPDVMIEYIKLFISPLNIIFTNKKNYYLHHHIIKQSIKDYEEYTRFMIRQDNELVVKKIIEENYSKWYKMREYRYKNQVFSNYLYFIMFYCVENDSNNCRNAICIFLKEHGLGKNLHKKNIVKYIKWKN